MTSSIGLQMRRVDPEQDERWDEYVMGHPESSIYHHSAWGRVLQKTYGFIPFCIALEDSKEGRFDGIVPFMLIKSWLTGKRLVSLPFTSYCDLLAPSAYLEDIMRFALKTDPAVKYAKLKLFRDGLGDFFRGFEKKDAYVTHILDVNHSPKKLFRSFHGSSVRQRIRRAEREKLKFRLAEKEADLVDFYRLEARLKKKHGLPPQPYSFFVNMWRILKPKNFLHVPLVEYGGKVIAGAILLKFGNSFHLEYSASDQQFLKLCPNQMLIWECIKMAIENGAETFDFGRSALSNKSLVEFKERWGAERRQLSYYLFPKIEEVETEKGPVRNALELVNRKLPVFLLRLEGRLVYPHLGL